MRIKEGFELLDVCGASVIVAHGKKNIDFSRVINLNETAAYLWQAVEERDFDEQELARLLCLEYEVDEDVALRDVTKMVQEWKAAGLIE
ncbi:MAG: PqqD family protein [Bacteroidaceae bacterium]|nr:PqqD family protein [Bacteroidaceae bacterium]